MFSPCYNSIPCPVTENDLIGRDPEIEQKAACAEVFAGHFTTKLVSVIADSNGSGRHTQCQRNWGDSASVISQPSAESPGFDCLIAVREPISRFVSHYYHFIEKDNPAYHGKRLKSMTIEEITTIIHNSANNTMVDYLSKHMPFTYPDRQADSFTQEEKINEAGKFLEQCIVVVMEDWDTSARLAETSAPWLKGSLVGAAALNVKKTRKDHETIEDFAPDIATALQEMLKGDEAVYRQALKVHEQQVVKFGIESEVAVTKSIEVEEKPVISSALDLKDDPFVKAVTYYGRGNPLNFWDQRFEDFIDADFESFKKIGFNALVLLVPWAGVQVTVVPPTYKPFMLERIEFVLKKATEYGLYTIFRMSFPHSYDPMNNPPTGHERCTMVMSEDRSNGIMEGWLDYMSTMNAVFTKEEYKSSYLYSFTSWEDFFCLIAFSQTNGDNQQQRLKLSKQIGFDNYLLEGYTPEELRDMFEGTPDIIAGEYPISRWDVADKAFPAYIKFIDKKWWELVELGRTVHPNLTMEIRVDIEAGKVPYDMHADDEGPPKQVYWGGYMGSKKGVPLHSETALKNLEKVLVHATVGGKSPSVLSQYNFQDNTPHLVMRNIVLEECNEFLEKSAAILKKYTKGYGLWAYRNYRQSEIFNGSFMLGLEGWASQVIGQGTVGVDEEGFMKLSGLSMDSIVKIEQGVKQLPEIQCDSGNNEMEISFKYRMKGNDTGLHVVWDGKKVDKSIDFTHVWKEKCLHVPTLEVNKFYTIGFQVEGNVSANIDNVEVFCHTHMMYMNDVNNERISTCSDGIHNMNRLLGRL